MSLRYANMDHADWVTKNIAASKRCLSPKQKRRTTGYAVAPDRLSPFQETVINIIGIVGGGIYNAPIAWDAIRWSYGFNGMAVPWRGNLSTFDFQELSELVFLCQTARIRCNIAPHSPKHLLICFVPREATGSMGRRHPNAEQMFAAMREAIPPHHPIVYAGDREAPENNDTNQKESAA